MGLESAVSVTMTLEFGIAVNVPQYTEKAEDVRVNRCDAKLQLGHTLPDQSAEFKTS